jgi:uncharacterized phage protein (TIGR02220 family)
MLKIKHLYGFEGVGIYWTIIENLREQDEYKWEYNDNSIQFLATVIGVEYKKLHNFINDCINIGLFKNDTLFFYSEALIGRMDVWEKARRNGQKGGRPPEKKGKVKGNHKGNYKGKHKGKVKGNHKGKHNHEITDITDIIYMFNEVTGKNCSLTHRREKQIEHWLEKGYKKEQFKGVTEYLFNLWKGDPKMKNYITPETFFKFEKFEENLDNAREHWRQQSLKQGISDEARKKYLEGAEKMRVA